MQTSDKGERKIMAWEACALRAYRDVVGVWTIGFGLTNQVGELPFKIVAGVTITFEQAVDLFRKALRNRYEPSVNKRMAGTTQSGFDMGTSFHYNTGAISRASWVKPFLAGDFAAARGAFYAWNKGGGRVLAGLTRRRKEEWAMGQGDYGRIDMPALVDERGRIVGKVKIGGKDVPVAEAATIGHFKLGDTDPLVAAYRAQLTELGYLDATKPSATPQKFDKGMDAAVRKFQSHHPNLTKDGTIGPATRAALQRELDAARKLKTTTVTGTAATGGAEVARETPQVHGFELSEYLIYGIGAVAVLALLYVAWKYRDELIAYSNKQRGKTVA